MTQDKGKPAQNDGPLRVGMNVNAAIAVLARCKEFQASCMVDLLEINRAGPKYSAEIAINRVRHKIADMVAREASQKETITTSLHPREYATEFRFSGVFMATEDYHFLCRLVRELSQELEPKVRP